RAVLHVQRGQAQVGDGVDLADVARTAVAGEQGDLFGLVHGVEHLLDPLGDRGGGADPRAGAVAAVSVAAGDRGGGGQAGGGELEDRGTERGGRDRAVHPDVAVRGGDVERLVAAGPRGGGVDRGPVRVVVGRLDLERGRVGGLPVQHHLADGLT